MSQVNLIKVINEGTIAESECKMLMQTECVKQLLNYCAIQPGAKITIVVEHDHGQKATAELYDHAALVQSLFDSLEYFQSELV